jgi:hypothetical protein
MRFVNHSRNILHFGINAKNTFGFCESCPSFSREFLHVTAKVAIEIPERRWYNIREYPDLRKKVYQRTDSFEKTGK